MTVMSVAAPVPLWGRPKISPVTVPETVLRVGSLEKEKVKLSARATPQAKAESRAAVTKTSVRDFMVGTPVLRIVRGREFCQVGEDLDVIVLQVRNRFRDFCIGNGRIADSLKPTIYGPLSRAVVERYARLNRNCAKFC